MSRDTCYCFAGGGTGGHLTPGIAVAAELCARDSQCRIVFVGTGRPVESRIVADHGFEHRVLPIESMRTALRNPPRFLWRNMSAYRQARALLDELTPRAVIGLGGFASAPLVLATSRRNIPTLLLEQNVIPGRATRWLSKRASAVCSSFDETRDHLPHSANSIVTGNPVRPEIAALHANRRPAGLPLRAPQTLLILGGSQGARAINDAIVSFVKREESKLAGWRIVHQTGVDQCEEVRRAYADSQVEHVVEPFFTDMASLYRDATLVVARAGATTLAELACAGCPAILIPYPHAAANHQWHNARAYESAGAAVIVTQRDDNSTTGDLSSALTPLLYEPNRLVAMQAAMHSLAKPDAAERVAQTLLAMLSDRH